MPDAMPRVVARVSTRVFVPAIGFGKAVYGCGFSLIHVSLDVLFCVSRVWAAVISHRPAALLTDQSRSLAWPSSRHVFLRECVPFLRGRIRPPELKETFLFARLPEPVRVSLVLAW